VGREQQNGGWASGVGVAEVAEGCHERAAGRPAAADVGARSAPTKMHGARVGGRRRAGVRKGPNWALSPVCLCQPGRKRHLAHRPAFCSALQRTGAVIYDSEPGATTAAAEFVPSGNDGWKRESKRGARAGRGVWNRSCTRMDADGRVSCQCSVVRWAVRLRWGRKGEGPLAKGL
jgi:hypothetical protein